MTEQPSPRKKRGREGALDMLRSLAVVFALVIPLWYLGQASQSDSKPIRPVDPTAALQGFVQDTGAPVPSRIPEGWVVNVARGEPGGVRVGYVVGEHYLEFAGGRGVTFLETAAGKARDQGPVTIGGVTWRRYVSDDEQESLVRVVKGVTILVGGVRENVSGDEIEQLAALVR